MSNPRQFPNVRDKLSAPSKKTAFEKARLEAEEKRKREEAETAAVYKDFVASFDEGPSNAPPSGFRGGFRSGGGGRRHFSGARGAAAPPPPALRKRNIGDAFERDDEEEGGVFGGSLTEREKRRLKDGNSGLLAFENSGPAKRRGERYHADDESDSDTAAAHPKPTLLLSSLPPNITKAAITDLLLSSTPLKIDSVRIIPAPPPTGPAQPSTAIRKAASALVTLSQETPISDIDAAVSSLNGRYMGYGFWLGIARHLSSTVAGSTSVGLPVIGTQANPFGAKASRPTGPAGGRGGPHRGGFAPPPSFGGRAQHQSNALQVHVQPPQDLKTLKLIHRTIESLLTHGTEFEALLMSQDSVRNDPKFAWLWDARSPAGVYYRWKLWEIVTGFAIDKQYTPTVEIFDSVAGAVWVPPRKPLKYEWAGSLKDVVEDYDFMSDELDEDDSDDDHHRDDDRSGGLAGGDGKKQKGYLGVLERAKLIHLVSRMPTTTSKVRRGDVGRVMAFAMEHAEGGMGEEVVQILVSNVLKPLALTKAAKATDEDSDEDRDKEKDKEEKPDASAAKIVALWIISDVLSNSSLGVRAAWRYRQLFDTALREKKVFEHLGEIYRESGWGRMKAEKFRRMVVDGVLEGWEKWCIFPQTTFDTFLHAFLHGPEKKDKEKETETEKPLAAAESAEQKSRSHTPTAAPTKSRWKTVDATPSAFDPKAQQQKDDDEGVDGEPMVDDDEDVDGVPMVDDGDEDADGVPMAEAEEPVPENEKQQPEEEEEEEEEKPSLGMGFGGMAGFKMGGPPAASVAGQGMKRKRPKAEDMFADDYD
ncbi:hypothetical protein FN846DRAFT_779148 [Sphaerosporella brunnea]|uniref:CID domain-containing protein n=1 Tax=Sphaerosporella brunnea TaxID=1250544 RepID=A0A5J5EW34_9PEZI|nr:hypothetical protein FN846DRAFT_779148 [Sphaerosporella brunnea]